MKANYIEFVTTLDIGRAAEIFKQSVKKRPLKLRALKSDFFTPTVADNPFAGVDGSVSPDFEVGATLEVPFGPDPARGTVILSCLRAERGTQLMLRSTGNMRGRLATNSLMDHVLAQMTAADPTIRPDRSSGRI